MTTSPRAGTDALPQLRSERFRAEREARWQALEELIDKAERKGPASLTDAQMLEAPVLYRQALSALSVARETSLDQSLIGYLETLCARGYFFVYGARVSLWEQIRDFFATGWPAAARALAWHTLAATGFLVLGAVVGAILVAGNPDWFDTFVDPGLASGRNPDATTAFLRETLYDGSGEDPLTAFATYLFANNARVAILAFALGFAFGIPTIIVLAMNGAMIGALIWLFASRGLGFELMGWLLIHGVTELLAIVIAGGAGLMIGLAAAFPGDRPRLRAMSEAGRTAATAMGGVIVMLLLAGVLESFGRQLIQTDWIRYAIAGSTALIWALYLYAPRGPAKAPQ